MTPDNPFLKALIAEPEDDTLRLAMADWFEENGDLPRGEFIRVQIELARGVVDRARRLELEARQSKLLLAHDAGWVTPLAQALRCKPGEWGGWVFRRGFVEYFRLGAHHVAERGFRLAHLTPVREIYLEYRKGRDDAVDLTEMWHLPWVRSLTHVYNLRLDARTAEAMLRAPRLPKLRHLTVTGELPDELWERFRQHFGGVLRGG